MKGVVINVLCLYETDFYTVRGYRGKFFALHLDLLFFAFFRENLLKMKPVFFVYTSFISVKGFIHLKCMICEN